VRRHVARSAEIIREIQAGMKYRISDITLLRFRINRKSLFCFRKNWFIKIAKNRITMSKQNVNGSKNRF